MDRTIIAPFKAEERELSERLYTELKKLSVIHPMSEDLEKLLSCETFIKPNQAAFFQVMAYLFRLLDPAEFKRRFFWPLSDKKSEASFRSSAVEYLSEINDKHKRGWTNIKSHLVQMPGGMRFLRFLSGFIDLIVQEEIKQLEKQLATEPLWPGMAPNSIDILARNNDLLKRNASVYMGEVKEQTGQIKELIGKLNASFEDMAQVTGISTAQLRDKRFLEAFEASNRALAHERIIQPMNELISLEESLGQLQAAMRRYLAEEMQPKYKPETIRNVLHKIRELFASHGLSEDEVPLQQDSSNGSTFQFNTLLRAYNLVDNTIKGQLAADDYFKVSDFVMSELKSINAEIGQAEAQATEFQQLLKSERSKTREAQNGESFKPTNDESESAQSSSSGERNNSKESSLLLKFMYTPPIKLEQAHPIGNLRLPLQDDCTVMKTSQEDSNTVHCTFAHPNYLDNSFNDLNATLKRSKIVDSTQLLRTLKRNTVRPKCTPLQNLCSKWKRELVFDKETEQVAKRELDTSMSLLVTPFNGLTSSPHSDLERSPENNSSTLLAKTPPFDAKTAITVVRTSPSGRLDPLIASNGNHAQSMLSPENTMIYSLDAIKEEVRFTNELDENNGNFNFDVNDIVEEDAILDISDSVLDDIVL